jgi:NAD(P) transhydrogenase
MKDITMDDLNYRVQRVIENEVAVIQDQLQRNGVEVIHGEGSFLDAHRVQVESAGGRNELGGANILIATGTKPAVNPKVPVNGRNIIDSDQILTMAQLPKH